MLTPAKVYSGFPYKSYDGLSRNEKISSGVKSQQMFSEYLYITNLGLTFKVVHPFIDVSRPTKLHNAYE